MIDTTERADRIGYARLLRERLLRAVDSLDAEADAMADDPERQDFRRRAAAAGDRYADQMTDWIDTAVSEEQLQQADLVVQAAECAGWLTATTVLDHRSMAALITEGVFGYHAADPGRWVACYRLGATD